MAVDPIFWPISALRPKDVTISPLSRNTSTDVSLSGVQQIISSDAGIWKIKYENIPVLDRQSVLIWRALEGLLQGRLNRIIVPIREFYQPYLPGTLSFIGDPTPFSDGAFFSDGIGFGTVAILVKVGTPAARRATAIHVAIFSADIIVAGQHFSIANRMYRITQVSYGSLSDAVLQFTPPLREAVTVNDVVEFDNPSCIMRLLNDDGMMLKLDTNLWGFPAVEFIEAP